MRRRLLASTALIALAAVVVLGVPLGVVEAHRVRGEARTQLLREADVVAPAVEDRLERNEPVDARRLAPLVRAGTGCSSRSSRPEACSPRSSSAWRRAGASPAPRTRSPRCGCVLEELERLEDRRRSGARGPTP